MEVRSSKMTNQEIRDEINRINKQQVKAVWYNPTKETTFDKETGKYVLPETIYIGEASAQNQVGASPTWNEAVMDAHAAKIEMQNYIKSAGTGDSYKVKVDPFIGEWKDIAHELADLRSNAIKSGSTSNLKSAGIGQSGDFSTIDIVNVQNEMINTELRQFSLEMAVTTVATPSLLLSVDTYTRFTGQKSIGELTPPTTKLGAVSRTTFTLPKDGTAIGLSFEAQTKASHDLYRTHVDNAITDLKRIKANKIATELLNGTDVSAGDWAAYTTDHSTRSPYDDIGTVSDTIVSNNGVVDTIATADRAFRDFMGNTQVKGFGGQGPNHEGIFSQAKVVDGASFGLPGITWYIDNELLNTSAFVYDKGAIYKMQGPVRTAVFRDEMLDADMFRIFDFNLPKIQIAGRIRELTSVSA